LPGNNNYELAYSLAEIPLYIEQLGSGNLAQGYQWITNHEQHLAGLLLEFLNAYDDITIIGEINNEAKNRVSTIAFVHEKLTSDVIVNAMDKYNIGIRYGDFYAVDLIDDLGLRSHNGVVRVSAVHYNTVEEVKQLITYLTEIFNQEVPFIQ